MHILGVGNLQKLDAKTVGHSAPIFTEEELTTAFREKLECLGTAEDRQVLLECYQILKKTIKQKKGFKSRMTSAKNTLVFTSFLKEESEKKSPKENNDLEDHWKLREKSVKSPDDEVEAKS
ncbi:uncharacterized protein LOC111701129 [Eurytemora carolleeae]|uniref:uncharacterized protein LOC111701129 n=1 Tax=Eurytemora carolleeae TaxID=1294199 RepID=UPI000C760CA9|nr:uncharacterized protein LOC111701129 [Eurytemora carolleeae]|eukprot:XP_023328061.1 uncharacterized protein LOC111701129 [Eurytemora affinis]